MVTHERDLALGTQVHVAPMMSIAEQVKGIVRDRILSGGIRPGEKIAIDHLKRELSVSGTPIRDALLALERDGLVRVLPRRGVYVAEIGPREIRDVFDARIALETLAAEGAVPRIPEEQLLALSRRMDEIDDRWRAEGSLSLAMADEFDRIHDLIREYTDNLVARELLRTLSWRIRLQRLVVLQQTHRYEMSGAEHRAILQALLARDTEAAATAIRGHLLAARDHTLQCFSHSR